MAMDYGAGSGAYPDNGPDVRNPQGEQMKLMTDQELWACWDGTREGLRAIERIATQRALEAAAEVVKGLIPDGGTIGDSYRRVALFAAEDAIRAMVKEVANG